MKEIASALPPERVTSARHTDQPLLSDAALTKKFQENGTELVRCLVDLCDQRIGELASEATSAVSPAQQQQQQQTLNGLFDKLRTERNNKTKSVASQTCFCFNSLLLFTDLNRYAAVEEVIQRANDIEREWAQIWRSMSADDATKQSYMIPLVRTLQTKELELKALEVIVQKHRFFVSSSADLL